MIHETANRAKELILLELNVVEEMLLNGQVTSMEAYAGLRGQRHAYHRTLAAIEQASKEMEQG